MTNIFKSNGFKFNLFNLRVFFLYGLCFSLAFEGLQILSLDNFTITKLFGFFYFAIWLLSLNKLLSAFAKVTTTKLTLILLFTWLLLASIIRFFADNEELSIDSTLLQSIVLFYLISIDLKNSDKSIQKNIFISIILGVSFASVLLLNSVGIESSSKAGYDSISEVRRIYFFGMNPNDFGALAALSLILSVWLIKTYTLKDKKMYAVLMCIPFIFVAIGYSASRGSFFSAVIGIILLFTLSGKTVKNNLKSFFWGLLLTIIFIHFSKDFTMLTSRIMSFITEQDTGGRLERWLLVSAYIADYPVFGVTSSSQPDFLKAPNYVNPHNAFLLYGYRGGIIASLILVSFFTSLFFKSAKFWRYSSDAIYLVITITCLLIVSKSGKGMDFKFVWILLACVSTRASVFVQDNKFKNN